MKPVITAEHVEFRVQGHTILKDVSLQAGEGEFVGLIGPNGSGKSTLLKNICKVYHPTKGRITLFGQDAAKMTNRQAAARLAAVAQEHGADFDFTVEEVVSMGRYPKKGRFGSLNGEDRRIVGEAIRRVGLQKFAGQSFLSLSGGEKQRTLIARALAQQTDAVILDEPTNHLDIGSQLHILNLMKTSGKTVLAALHDLAAAANFCDRIYVLQNGGVLCSGSPREILTQELIRALYGVDAEVFEHRGKLFVDYR
ncbi:iron-dicitrate transporter subunit; ATP-binding component of ABC superfamily; KpLE2 phage-like element [Ruminococcaceae bacterium BL-6]|nr:iron-dicitrate transporter subunit; ATP-binding component of ABC superfamily; KpLE2 phage-like element [Ruminococcaceae bacterium BL-6]